MIVCHCFKTEIWLFAATRLCWNAYVGFSFLALSGQRWITDVLVGMKASRSELFGHSTVPELLREVWTVWMIDIKNYLHSIVHIQFKIAKWFHSSAQTPWKYSNYISNILVCHSAQGKRSLCFAGAKPCHPCIARCPAWMHCMSCCFGRRRLYLRHEIIGWSSIGQTKSFGVYHFCITFLLPKSCKRGL